MEWILGGALIYLSVCDIKTKEIPSVAAYIVCGGSLIYGGITHGIVLLACSGIIGAIVCIAALIWPQIIGLGDGIILISCGAIVGNFYSSIMIFQGALVLSALLGIVVILVKKKKNSESIPFIPSITLSYLLWQII